MSTRLDGCQKKSMKEQVELTVKAQKPVQN